MEGIMLAAEVFDSIVGFAGALVGLLVVICLALFGYFADRRRRRRKLSGWPGRSVFRW